MFVVPYHRNQCKQVDLWVKDCLNPRLKLIEES